MKKKKKSHVQGSDAAIRDADDMLLQVARLWYQNIKCACNKGGGVYVHVWGDGGINMCISLCAPSFPPAKAAFPLVWLCGRMTTFLSKPLPPLGCEDRSSGLRYNAQD